MKVLDHLASLRAKERLEHPLQRRLEEIVKEVLTKKELELYYMRFGEQESYRTIAKRMNYASHRTFQLQINTILKKVREALGSTNLRDV
jgi:predicted DNA-binding protein (UPF0251 family)